jgi:DNA polymerase-2
MQTLDGFILTRHWRDTPSGTVVDFWLATDQGPRLMRRTDVTSVSFVPVQYQGDVETVISTMHGVSIKTLELQDFSGRPVLGVYSKHFRQQALIEKELNARNVPVYEADIKPPERYLMERFLTASVTMTVDSFHNQTFSNCRVVANETYRPKLKIVAMAIEADQSGALRLISLFSPGCSAVISLEPLAAGTDTQALSISKDFELTLVSTHAEMIRAVNSWFQINDPDAIMGWNLIQFELRVLQLYADKCRVPLNLGRGGSSLDLLSHGAKDGKSFTPIAGRIIVAGGDAVKAAIASFVSATFLDVVEALLPGETRPDHPYQQHLREPEAFTIDLMERLARYSMNNSQMVARIFEQANLLRFMMDRASVTGLQADHFGGSIAAFDHHYLPRMHREGFVAPNIGDVVAAPYPGGYVLDSTPGLYDSVVVLDYKSLYASIIRTFLIDPVGMAIAKSCADSAQIVAGINGTTFSRTKHCLPAIVNNIWERRDQAKLDKNEPLSQALKLLMNSFCGVLGSPDCRFFDPKLVSAITLRGHDIISQSRDIIEGQGYSVIYGDTDSIFISLGEIASNERALETAQRLVVLVNQWWTEFALSTLQIESKLEIEFDIHYRKFFLPTLRGSDTGSKKRYAGMVSDADGRDEIIYRGLESARSDWTPLAQKFQRELYQRIFHDQPFDDFIRDYAQQTMGGNFDSRLVYKKRIRYRLVDYVKNVPPQVRAAKLADDTHSKNGRPMRYQNGGWISYVMTLNGPQPAEFVTSPVDYEHYLDHQLKPIADSILAPLNSSFSSIVTSQQALF